MAALKQKLDKVLHRREQSDDRRGVSGDEAAPSPTVSRTSEDKRHGRNKSSTLRDIVRSATPEGGPDNADTTLQTSITRMSLTGVRTSGRSRTRPSSRNSKYAVDSTPVRSSREYTQQSPPMPQAAASTVRRVEDHRDLSSEFKQLELNNSINNDGHQRAQRGSIDGRKSIGDQIARRPVSQHLESGTHGMNGSPRSVPFASAEDPYSEAVADFNIARDEAMLAGGLEDQHAIRQALQRDQREDGVQPRRSRDVNCDVINVRRSNDLARPSSSRRSNEAARITIPAAAIPSREGSLDWQHRIAAGGRARANTGGKRLSIDKPLPPAPEGQAVKNFSTPSTQPRPQADYMVQDSDTPVDLAAHGFDLRNTEDTTVHRTQAVPVVHEQIRVDTQEIITERIEREIHTHDVFHRVLPIVDIEVLPPRHFIQTPQGGRYEISPEQAPGGAAQNLNLQRVIQEAIDREVARLYPPQVGPRTFTAVDFNPWTTAGDKREGVGEDGCKYSEQTWVHHPVIEMGGYESGQTVPVHFDHAAVQASAGGVVGSRTTVHDDHEGGIGRLPTAALRRASVTTRKPVRSRDVTA